MNEVTNGVYVIKYNPGREQNYTIWKDKQVIKFVSWYKLPVWAKDAFKGNNTNNGY